VTDRAQVERMVRDIVAAYGQLDVLVNNARPVPMSFTSYLATDAQEIEARVIAELRAVDACCRSVFPVMKAQGGGRIINVSTAAARQTQAVATKVTAPKTSPCSATSHSIPYSRSPARRACPANDPRALWIPTTSSRCCSGSNFSALALARKCRGRSPRGDSFAGLQDHPIRPRACSVRPGEFRQIQRC
jgi:hypothetical protein